MPLAVSDSPYSPWIVFRSSMPNSFASRVFSFNGECRLETTTLVSPSIQVPSLREPELISFSSHSDEESDSSPFSSASSSWSSESKRSWISPASDSSAEVSPETVTVVVPPPQPVTSNPAKQRRASALENFILLLFLPPWTRTLGRLLRNARRRQAWMLARGSGRSQSLAGQRRARFNRATAG